MPTTDEGAALPSVGGTAASVLAQQRSYRANRRAGVQFAFYLPGTRLFPESPARRIGNITMVAPGFETVVVDDVSPDPTSHAASLMAAALRDRERAGVAALNVATGTPVFPVDAQVRASDFRGRVSEVINRPALGWRSV